MKRILYAAAVALGLLGLSGPGCKRDEAKLATPAMPARPPASLVAKPAEQPLPPGHPSLTGSQPLPPGHPPVNARDTRPGVEAAARPGGLAWELPKGWSEARGDGMRFATLKPSAPEVEVSVVVLAGGAGGELGNVNRWRGQLGLSPIDEAARAQGRKSVRSPAGEISLYDFTGTSGQRPRMVAGLLVLGGKTWFFKMTGGDAAVGSAKADFVKLLESLRAT